MSLVEPYFEVASFLARVPEWDRQRALACDFRNRPPSAPLVLRNYAQHWPLVRAARRGPELFARLLMKFDGGQVLEAMIADPTEGGRLFYTEDLRQFNFTRMRGYLADALEILASQARRPRPVTFYIGSTSIPEYFSGLERECELPGLTDVAPNLWLGNSVCVATHNDNANNVACVAAGHRRFTLFPPDQEANLYIGEQPETPGGRPVSLVDLRAPDWRRFPRFRAALTQARVADLTPGDAIFIPRGWWHNVESFGPLNALVNFWW